VRSDYSIVTSTAAAPSLWLPLVTIGYYQALDSSRDGHAGFQAILAWDPGVCRNIRQVTRRILPRFEIVGSSFVYRWDLLSKPSRNPGVTMVRPWLLFMDKPFAYY
jgi:hypothetical protein